MNKVQKDGTKFNYDSGSFIGKRYGMGYINFMNSFDFLFCYKLRAFIVWYDSLDALLHKPTGQLNFYCHIRHDYQAKTHFFST